MTRFVWWWVLLVKLTMVKCFADAENANKTSYLGIGMVNGSSWKKLASWPTFVKETNVVVQDVVKAYNITIMSLKAIKFLASAFAKVAPAFSMLSAIADLLDLNTEQVTSRMESAILDGFKRMDDNFKHLSEKIDGLHSHVTYQNEKVAIVQYVNVIENAHKSMPKKSSMTAQRIRDFQIYYENHYRGTGISLLKMMLGTTMNVDHLKTYKDYILCKPKLLMLYCIQVVSYLSKCGQVETLYFLLKSNNFTNVKKNDYITVLKKEERWRRRISRLMKRCLNISKQCENDYERRSNQAVDSAITNVQRSGVPSITDLANYIFGSLEDRVSERKWIVWVYEFCKNNTQCCSRGSFYNNSIKRTVKGKDVIAVSYPEVTVLPPSVRTTVRNVLSGITDKCTDAARKISSLNLCPYEPGPCRHRLAACKNVANLISTFLTYESGSYGVYVVDETSNVSFRSHKDIVLHDIIIPPTKKKKDVFDLLCYIKFPMLHVFIVP